MVRHDEYLIAIAHRKMYGNRVFYTVRLDGKEIKHKGAYVMVDGGYLRWPSLQCANHASYDMVDRRLRAWIEQVRKKVETVFGILKGRFRILKVGMPYHDQGACERVMHTCCILHNMILSHDGLDKRWESDVDWAGKDGEFEEGDKGLLARKLALVYLRTTRLGSYKKADTCYSSGGMQKAPLSAEEVVGGEAGQWRWLNRCLAEHFSVMNQRGSLKWQKSVADLPEL